MHLKKTIMIVLLALVSVLVMAYKIRPGDVLFVSVYGSAELSGEIVVGPDGTASIPPLGSVAVLGKTLEEAESLLSGKYLSGGILATRPQVTVSVKSYAPFMFYVLGEVNKPGAIEWTKDNLTVSQMIALAGGLKDGADLSSSFLVESNGNRKHIDLSSFLVGGEASSITLAEGTTLFIPAGAKAWIRSIGEFRSPTLIRYNPGLTLTQVVAQSGGLTENADKKEILIIGEGVQGSKKVVDLNSVLSGAIVDPLIPAGSIVIANDSSIKSVKLLGEVGSPSSISFRDGLTLIQAIGQAGGVKSSAASQLFIIRSELSEPLRIELISLLKGEIKDVPLKPGDTIFIPRESEKFVYISSPTFGGKVQFGVDESITLANALVKVDLYNPASDESSILVEPSGERMEVRLNEDRVLQSGSMIIVSGGTKSIYIAGEVNFPGMMQFGNFDEITLAKVISRAGGYTEKAGSVEVISPSGKSVYSIEQALRSDVKLSVQSIVLVEKIEERYVYVVAPGSGGRIDFKESESFTLKNLLARLNLLNLNSSKEIEVIEPSGKVSTVAALKLKDNDLPLQTGAIVIVPALSSWVYVFGEVSRPGKIEVDGEDLTLTRVLSSSGGYTSVADISSVEVLSAGKSVTVNLQEILKGSIPDVKIKYDDLIYIPRLDSRFVYVVSRNKGGKIDFGSGENITLRNALAKLNLVEVSSEKTVRAIEPDGKITELSIKSLENSDVVIETGTIIFYPEPYSTASVLGQVRNPGTVTLQPDVPFTLSNILAAAGGLTERADHKRITVMVTDSSSVTIYDMDSISSGKAIYIKDGSTVFVPELESFYVYVVGGVKAPGVKTLDRDGDLPTVTKAIALAGGLIDPTASSIEIVENQSRQKLDLQRIMKGDSPDVKIASGSVIYVPEIPGKYIYIVSDSGGGRVDFNSSESLTLRNALAKENLLDLASDGRVTIISPDGSKRERILSDLKDSDISLQSGSIILYPVTQRQIYVLGAVRSPGTVLFKPAEKLTLSTLIAKVGGTTPEALMSKVQITDQFGRTSTVDLELILQGKALDVKLEDRTFVYVPVYEPITVNVLGEVRNPGQVTFSKTEIPGLLLAISKAGGLTGEASSEIKIVGQENQSYWYQLMEGQDITLKNGQTVFVPGRERYVYITGEVASTGRYDFTTEERMTVMRTLIKAGGVRETASDELRVITPSGQVIPVKLSELLSGKSDPTLETASTIVVPKKVARITVLGAVRNPGTYIFNRDESSSLADVVAKAGGLTDQKNVDRILVQISNEIKEFTVASIEKRSDNLPDNTFVYVTSLEAAYVTVLGDVPRPGRYSLEGTQPVSVAEIIATAGGLGDTVNTLSIVSADGKIKLLNALKIEDLTRNFLQKRDTIIVLKNYDSYVSIIGDVKSPGIFSIGDYGELSLAELITMAGGFNSLEFSRKVQIQSASKTEELAVGPDNFLLLSTKELEPGSVVFVPYIQTQRVYVFGEVLRPGVVKFLEGMTAIEAVIEAGGPTSYAVLGNALLFQDPQKEPLVLNLDQQKGSPVKGNVKLVPGNIIYVPQSSIVNIKDIMSIVASSLSIVNSAVGIFK